MGALLDIQQPSIRNQTLVEGADNVWTFRRTTTDGTPLIPTEATCEIADWHGGPVWYTPEVQISDDGYIHVIVPFDAIVKAELTDTAVYSVKVVYEENRYRWVDGTVTFNRKTF